MMRLFIMVSSQGISNELTDGGRVPLIHLLLGFKRFCNLSDGLIRQREHLEQMPVKSDELFLDQRVSGEQILIGIDAQKGTDLVKAVVGESLAIGHQDQKQVEQELMVAEAGPEALSHKAVLDEGEAAGDCADPPGTQWRSLYHGSPPWGRTLRQTDQEVHLVLFCKNG